MSICVTESELLAELRKSTAVDDDAPDEAMTVSELCAALGLSANAVSRRLAKYRDQGRLAEYRVYRRDAQGRKHPMAAYVLLPEPTSRKRAG